VRNGTPPKVSWIIPRCRPASTGRGPIGLGFRVPGLVISPYGHGGLIERTIYDHTSQLRLVEARYGAPVPNLTVWRHKTVGDMTRAFNFAAAPDTAEPSLPASGIKVLTELAQCKVGVDALTGSFGSELYLEPVLRAEAGDRDEAPPQRVSQGPPGSPASPGSRGSSGGVHANPAPETGSAAVPGQAAPSAPLGPAAVGGVTDGDATWSGRSRSRA